MSDHSSQRSKSPTSSKSQSEEECELPCEGDLLVIRCMLGQIQKPFDERQRENIFHTRCLINNKLCSLIVDGVVAQMWQVQEWWKNLGYPPSRKTL